MAFEKIREEFRETKEDLQAIVKGYRFARYLVNDVRDRCDLVMEDISYPANNAALVLQLAEYRMAWADIADKIYNPYSAGIALYGLLHRKDDRFMTDFWDGIAKRAQED